MQHCHLDIGCTDPPGRVMAESRAHLDSLLDLCRDTDDWPEPARFRWAVEGFRSFQDWQATPFAVVRAVRTTYLGQPLRDIGPEPDGAIPVDVPVLGTAAVVLDLRSATTGSAGSPAASGDD